MSKLPPKKASLVHNHKWVYRAMPAEKPLENINYNGSKKGKQIVGYMCRCGERNYIDLVQHKR